MRSAFFPISQISLKFRSARKARCDEAYSRVPASLRIKRAGQPMHLDMQTMSAVSVAVTVVVGGVLLFTWAREREGPFVRF